MVAVAVPRRGMAGLNDEESQKAKLERFHSLLFGMAATAGDAQTSLGMRLRLAGFLANEVRHPEDESCIRKLLSEVNSGISAACQAIYPDKNVLEQASCAEGFQFQEYRPIDLDRIRSSNHSANAVPSAEEKSKTLRVLDSERAEPPMQSNQAMPLTDDAREPHVGSSSREQNLTAPRRKLCQSKLTHRSDSLSFKPPQNRDSARVQDSCKPAVSEDCGRYRSPVEDKQAVKRGSFAPYDSSAYKTPRSEVKDVGADYDAYDYRSMPKRKQLNRSGSDDDEYEGNGRRQNHWKQRKSRGAQYEEEDEIENEVQERPMSFVTARQQLALQEAKKNNGNSSSTAGYRPVNFAAKTLGMRSRGPSSAFVPPVAGSKANGGVSRFQYNSEGGGDESTRLCLESLAGPDGELPLRLRNIEPKLLEHVTNEVMEKDPMVRWDDIAGLEHAKKSVNEMVIWPLLRPDIFQGCRAPPKGLLLFGPPGTGKTMIGKAIAGEARATFFSISASSIMSKWLGEAEKLVRALFGVAVCRQPAVIFIDEVDSLLSQRKSDGEHDTSRKIKTQFLIEMEGCGTGTEQVLVIGATNRPQELDEAARRRLSKRLYIPLPTAAARSWIVRNLLGKDGLLSLSDHELDSICSLTEGNKGCGNCRLRRWSGYSGSDMKNLVKEASMGPLREALMHGKHITEIRTEDIRPISLQDFATAVQQVRPSVSPDELGLYEEWNKKYGSLSVQQGSATHAI